MRFRQIFGQEKRGILISESFPEIVPSVLEKVVILVNLYAEISENS